MRTDKAALERFFRSLRLSLLDKLPGYKGPNISSRGKDVEQGAFYYVTELEQLISALAEQHQFTVTEHVFELRGRCNTCCTYEAIIGDTPIAIDYAATFRPMGLARMLLEHEIGRAHV